MKMKTFYIVETQNSQSIKRTEKIEVKSLSAAKRYATKNQMYQGTVLKIYSDLDKNGYGVNLISSKNTGFTRTNKWMD